MNSIKDLNIDLNFAWFNEIKKIHLEYDEQKKKFFSVRRDDIVDVGNAFLVGFNFTMLKDKHFTCEFDHEPEERAY